MKIKQAYYHYGGKNNEGEVVTPYLVDDDDNEVYFLIRCSVCHYGLCKVITIVKSYERDKQQYKQNHIFVEPCPICARAAREGIDPPVIPLKALEYGLEKLEIEP